MRGSLLKQRSHTFPGPWTGSSGGWGGRGDDLVCAPVTYAGQFPTGLSPLQGHGLGIIGELCIKRSNKDLLCAENKEEFLDGENN